MDGNPFPKVTWYQGKVEVAVGVKFSTTIDTVTGIAALNVSKCHQRDDSPYTVTLHNDHGEADAEFHLYVKGIHNVV